MIDVTCQRGFEYFLLRNVTCQRGFEYFLLRNVTCQGPSLDVM
jgi:hypothetical protein